MAKKILAIFFVSILLCSYIIPTTSAKADVVVGDNDSYAVTELGVKNGKKIATMEAILQLLESGVSEINFNDITDLDEYLEDFYDELTNVNYQDVSNEILAGAYNDVKDLKQWIDDRGEFIATYYKDYLNSADQGLTDIFNHFNLKLEKTSLTRTPLDGVRGMSRFVDDSNQPHPDSNYTEYINRLNLRMDSNSKYFWFYDAPQTIGNYTVLRYPFTNYTWVAWTSNSGYYTSSSNNFQTPWIVATDIKDIYVNYINGVYSYNISVNRYGTVIKQYSDTFSGMYISKSNNAYYYDKSYESTSSKTFSYSNSNLSLVLEHICTYFKNVNLYVDNVLWSQVGATNPPTLDIDGFVKLYGNDNPIQYEFPQGTQIDYNALYTTIYNAIRDNLPLDMQTINNNQVYYDSHDTVYSPTIYNYYGKDGDDENDWIDSILDYATIPDFNAVLGTVAVLDAPFVNGITIVNAGVTDVIPTDILVILGGFFVLVLFVCIINRMSE